MKRKKSDYIVQSVVKALDILELMAESDGEYGVSELAQDLGVQKGSVHRILHTVEQRGYVEKNAETGNYRIGLKSFEVGQAYRHQLGLFRTSRPVLQHLVATCDEAAYIAVLRGPNVVYLDVIQTSKALRLASRVGSITPAFCTAVGKVLLAHLPSATLDRLMPTISFTPLTDKTILDPERLRAELARTVAVGYALDDEEYEQGVRCLAVPIWNHNREVIAGVSLSGPISRMTHERIETELLPLLMEAGKEISHRLGYDPHHHPGP